MKTFREMTRREKKEHLLEYYKFHIYGGLFAAFLIGSIVYAVFGPRAPEPAVNVVVMGLYTHNEEELGEFEDELANLIDDSEYGPAALAIHRVDWDSGSSMTVTSNQKLLLMFQAKEIDVMIVEQSKYDFFMETVQDCVYEPLDDQPLLQELLEKNKDTLITGKADEESKEMVYGLSSKDSERLQEIGLGDDFVISVPTVSEKKENAFKTINWLYE